MNKAFTVFIIYLVTFSQLACQPRRLSYEVVFGKKVALKDTYQIEDLVELPDGGYFLTGGVKGKSIGMNPCVVRLNKQGKLLWAKQYNKLEDISVIKSIQRLNYNRYLLIGYSRLDEILFSLEVDTKGNFGNYKAMTKISSKVHSVKKLGNGDLIITGGDKLKMLLIKTNRLGKMLWKKTYDSFGRGYAEGRDVLPVSGGYQIAGGIGDESQVQFGVLKTNQNGDSLWTKTYSSDRSRALVLQKTGNSREFLAGGVYETWVGAQKNAFLVKYNQQGDTLWTRRFGANKGDELVDIRVSGGYYTAIVNTQQEGDNYQRNGMIVLYIFSPDGVLKDKKFLSTKNFKKGWVATKLIPSSTTGTK